MIDPLPNGIPHEQLAALSHEFRTPLNGVIGMARLLESTRLTEEQRAYVAALTESGEHLLGLVNDVLDYARLGAGAVELNRGLVAPEDLLRQVCELLSPKAHEKGVEIGWAAGADLGPVSADEGRLRQILLNLAGNAVKFVETGGILVLAEKTTTGALRFTVSDTGPGVPQAERARIFEAFAQGASGRHAHQVGAGLGLAIAKRLADAMGGRLGVGGKEGAGADFWFEAEFEPAEPRTSTASLEGRTVAVASPSAIVREAASRQVEASGGRAIRAESVDQAVAMTGEGDAILVDHALAGAADPLTPPRGRATVILLKPEERDRITPYREAGFSGYLIKPLRRASLVERVTLAGKTQAPDDRIARRARRAPSAEGVRVLLAEDNPINAMLARTLLRREGAEVAHVEGGEAALEALGAGAYDIVLMDVRMPGMGGLAATRTLRARGVNTPVVALTANAFEDDRRACLEAGMDDFLVKPLSPDALRTALARWTGHGWTREVARVKVAS
jgi:CheY-like chemotaxis protein